MSLLQLGSFTLASGINSPWKIDCDCLTESDWNTAAYLISKLVGRFGEVEGVPTGGLKLAEALKPYITKGPLLVVDDVWTTGGSILKHLNDRKAKIAVLFARSNVPKDVIALFRSYTNI